MGARARAGANGDIEVSFRFLKVARLGRIAEFTLPLGDATAGVEIEGSAQKAYFSGSVEPDASWLPGGAPRGPPRAPRRVTC